VAWSPDGKQVLTGSYDHTAVVWDVAARKPVHILDLIGNKAAMV